MVWMRVRLLVAATLASLLVACNSGGTASPSSSSPPIPSIETSSPPFSPSGSPGDADWLTYHRDPARTGFDPSSTPVGSVKRAWTSPKLDGAIYAQPLVLGGRILVATENDSIYALDVGTGKVVWRTRLGEPVPRSLLPCGNIDPTGITGTPVVDSASGLLYAVAFVQPGRHELVAVDTASGKVRFRRAADPQGTDSLVHQQRAAL